MTDIEKAVEEARRTIEEAAAKIDWNELREKVNASPEMVQLQKEIEYLQTVNDIFEGRIKIGD